MPNYANGKIYQIISPNYPLPYIGSTTQLLCKRMVEHRKPSHWSRCSSRILIEAGDAYIELIEDFPCDNKEQLNRREGEIMRGRDCVNRNIAGRTQKEYQHDNPELVKIWANNYREANREAIRVQQKAHNEANREAISSKRKAHREANPAHYKARYQANRQTILAQQKAYNEANPEVRKARDKAYNEANREAICAQKRARYALKKTKSEATESPDS
jgi:hypothetical protein